MKLLVCFSFFLSISSVFSQPEEAEYPLLINPYVKDFSWEAKALANSFDSTFHFLSDTLSLPFFDDFSTSLFQEYKAQFTDPNVSSEVFYRLMDVPGINPLPNNVKFVEDSTLSFHRYVNASTGNFTDSINPAIYVSFSDLSVYPAFYESKALYPAYQIYDTIGGPPNNPDTVLLTTDLVTQDSARIFLVQIQEPDKKWLDHRAYHNYRFARNPWTLGVATFDGLDERGQPYNFASAASSYADVLTSKPIKLSNYAPADSIYLSFLYQPEGWGEKPESGDSLVLEFKDPLTKDWYHVWGVNGSSNHDFKVVHLPIVAAQWFGDDFQFRFRNYGSLAGALDHFHLDYVHMRTLSSVGDTLFKDFAFVYPIKTLLQTYTSVPWDHYKNASTNKMSNNVEVVVRNGSNIPENFQNGSVRVSHEGNFEGNFVLQGQNLANGAINYAPRTTYYSYHDFSGGYQFDKTKPGTKQVFDIKASAVAQFSNPPINDTARTEQYFGFYYSRDDGTAERAYGPTSAQARLAIQYTPYEADSLIGAMIHFVPSVVDASNSLFVLTVWADNNGQPGSVIYEDDLFFPKEPVYEEVPNRFTRYFFKDSVKVPVNGRFYIGWRQFDGNTLNVGLDKNIDQSSKTFFSVNAGGSWNVSQISGSVMIRPMFSTSMNGELGLPEKEDRVAMNWYVSPNPGVDHFQINGAHKDAAYIIQNLAGQQILSGIGNQFELTDFPSGLYFVRISGSNAVFKVIKQ